EEGGWDGGGGNWSREWREGHDESIAEGDHPGGAAVGTCHQSGSEICNRSRAVSARLGADGGLRPRFADSRPVFKRASARRSRSRLWRFVIAKRKRRKLLERHM